MPTSPDVTEAGVPATVRDVLAQLYDEVAASLAKIVLHPPGPADAPPSYRVARAAQLIGEVERLRRNLNQQSAQWVGTNLPIAYGKGMKLGEAQALQSGVPESKVAAIHGAFSQVDEQALIVLARETIIDLNGASRGMTERATRLIRATAQRGLDEAKINSIISRGIIEGDPRAAVGNMRQELIAVHGKKIPLTDKNGDRMEWDAGPYARLVVTTKTRAATTLARHEKLTALGRDLVAVAGPTDSEDFCTAFVGQVFSISGNSSEYPSIRVLPGLYPSPPFHPHCRHTTRPFVPELATASQLEIAKGLPDIQQLYGKSLSQATRLFKDLQLGQQQRGRFAAAVERMLS